MRNLQHTGLFMNEDLMPDMAKLAILPENYEEKEKYTQNLCKMDSSTSSRQSCYIQKISQRLYEGKYMYSNICIL